MLRCAWRRKLAPPSCRWRVEHSSPLPASDATAQHERSPNGALITLREPPSPGPKIEHRTKRGGEGRDDGPDFGRQKAGSQGWEPLCSQNAHDEAVLVRCAHDGAPHPQPPLNPRPQGWRREGEKARWTRAVWPSPAACPRRCNGPRKREQ